MSKVDELRQAIKAVTDAVAAVNRTLAEVQREFDLLNRQSSERDTLVSKVKSLEETIAKIKGFFS